MAEGELNIYRNTAVSRRILGKMALGAVAGVLTSACSRIGIPTEDPYAVPATSEEHFEGLQNFSRMLDGYGFNRDFDPRFWMHFDGLVKLSQQRRTFWFDGNPVKIPEQLGEHFGSLQTRTSSVGYQRLLVLMNDYYAQGFAKLELAKLPEDLEDKIIALVTLGREAVMHLRSTGNENELTCFIGEEGNYQIATSGRPMGELKMRELATQALPSVSWDNYQAEGLIGEKRIQGLVRNYKFTPYGMVIIRSANPS